MFKKLAISSAVALATLAMAPAAQAQWRGGSTDAEEVLRSLIDDDDILDTNVITVSAINLGDVDASVEIDADDDATITMGVADATATATATANADSGRGGDIAEAVAEALAHSGNKITTLAIGAYLNNEVTADVSGWSNIEVEDESDEFDFEYRGQDVNIHSLALNDADINASVRIDSDDDSRYGGGIEITNLHISTTAIGAYNAGKLTVQTNLLAAPVAALVP